MKLLIKLVKYYPIIVNISIVLMMIEWYFTKENILLYPYIGQSFYLNSIILILSHNLKFCTWHRILIYSMSFVLFLETISRYGVNINYYLYICIVVSILALTTSTILYYKNGCHSNRTIKNIKKNCRLD